MKNRSIAFKGRNSLKEWGEWLQETKPKGRRGSVKLAQENSWSQNTAKTSAASFFVFLGFFLSSWLRCGSSRFLVS